MTLEQDIFRDEFDRAAIERLYQVKHQVLRLRNAVYPVEDICSQLIRLHEELVPKELRAYFRDIEDHASRIVRTLDVVREMLTTAVQVNLALVTVGQNEVVKRLAGWGAILAVPTVIFSLYGMNFSFMPELKLHYAYPVVIGVTATACTWLWRKVAPGRLDLASPALPVMAAMAVKRRHAWRWRRFYIFFTPLLPLYPVFTPPSLISRT